MSNRSIDDAPQTSRTRRIIEAWGNNTAYLINIGLLIFLIVIASYATMELAARIAARGFVDMRMQEVRTQLGALAGQRTQVTSEAASPAASSTGSDISALRVRESELKVLSESIVALEYAGASDGTKTVYALQTRYEGFATRKETQVRDAQLTSEAFDLERRVTEKTKALQRLDTSVSQYGPFFDVSRQEAQDYFRDYEGSFITDLADLLNDRNVFSALREAQEVAGLQQVQRTDPSLLSSRLLDEMRSLEELPLEEFDLLQKQQALFSSSLPDNALAWLDDIRNAKVELERQITVEEQRLTALSEQVTKAAGEGVATVPAIPKWAQRLGFIYEISFFPSDIVLAIVVISCGAIGSLFAGLRAGAPSPATRAPIGAVSGFVTFAVIKGGKFLFIVQSTASVMPINPYAAAFSGLLAGLFTERAYRLLEAMVDKAAAGIEKGESAKNTSADDGDMTLRDFVNDAPDPAEPKAAKDKPPPTEPLTPHRDTATDPAEIHSKKNPSGKKPVVVS